MKFFLALILFQSSIVLADPKKLEDYWTEVALPFKKAERVMTSAKCYDSHKFKVFLGCIRAVEAVVKETHQLLPVSLNRPLDPTSIEKQFGAALLVKVSKESLRDAFLNMEAYSKYKQKRQEETAAWRAAFDLTSGPRIDFDGLWAWARQHVVTQKNESHLAAEAFNALMRETHGPYHYILPKRFIDDKFSQTDDEIGGIGAGIGGIEKNSVIAEVFEGSPAQKAGLLVNDIIVEIDGETVREAGYEAVTLKIRGAKGTKVDIKVLRDQKTLHFSIERDNVKLPFVFMGTLQDREHEFAYVRLSTFTSKKNCSEFKEAIKRIKKSKASGMILDLRGNPGGLMDECACIAGTLIGPEETVFLQKNLDPVPWTDFYVTPPETDPDATTELPLVVLIDEASASASELLAGVIQDYERGLVLGTRSFGKGTTQGVFNWKHWRNTSYFQTIAQFYLPSGRTTHIHGISPDIEVLHKPDASSKDQLALRAEDEEDFVHTASSEKMPSPRKIKPEFASYLDKIRECVKSSGKAKETFEDKRKKLTIKDYRILMAQDALECILKNPI